MFEAFLSQLYTSKQMSPNTTT